MKLRYTNPGLGYLDLRYLKLDCSNDPLTGNLNFQGAYGIYFRDGNTFIYSGGSGSLTLVATSQVLMTTPSVQIGRNVAEDLVVNFNSLTNDGIITWKDTENYFSFGNDVNLGTNNLTADTGRFDSGVYAGTAVAASTLVLYAHDGLTGTDVISINGGSDNFTFTDVSGDILTFAAGSITSSTGSISFGDENISTTGTLGCGVITQSGSTLDNTYLNEASNLSDLNDVATARTNLGLIASGTGDIWVEKAGDIMTGGLTFNYTTPIIATSTNQNLSLIPNGTGYTIIGTGTSSLTGYTLDKCNGGTVDDEYDTGGVEGAVKAFDNDFTGSKYLTNNSTTWISYQFPGSATYIIQKYTITSGNDVEQRDPVDWTFQGSNNGSDWDTLDTRTSEDFPNRLQKREFTFSNSTAYEYYKLDITANAGDGNTQIEEIEMMEDQSLDNNSLFVSGKLEVDGVTTFDGNIASDIIPDSGSAYDLGSSSFYWDEIYVDQVNFNSTANLRGDTAGIIEMTGKLRSLAANDGLFLQAEAQGTLIAALRITGNTNAWADNVNAAYFQCDFNSTHNLTFQSGTAGADSSFARLQFSSELTTITDIDYNNTPVPTGMLELITDTAAKKVLIVRGATSQSANLQEWQTVTPTTVAYITPTGGALFGDKVIFTQSDGNEYIDSLADGYLDIAATTGVRVTSSSFTIIGTNGTLNITAETDGGDYNFFTSNGTQTLAFYGSGGNVLNLELLDGTLQVDNKVIFTQDDGNEYIDSLADGYLDLAATTGIRLHGIDTAADPRLTFVSGNSGYIEWQEDELQFHIDGGFETSTFINAGGGIILPTADPHIADAWWDNSGVLTKSTG